jgi:hypothetical protein
MLSLDPNAMDTRVDRSRSFNKNCRTQGHTANITTDATETQQKEGRCFTCNKQGHISRNCPDKKKKDKAPVKACKAETEDSGAEGDGKKSDKEEPISPEAFVHLGKTMKEKDKIAIIKAAIEAEQGKEGPGADF